MAPEAEASFGDRLRELRKEKGLTQKDLADKVKINFTYLSKIETGSAPPPAEDTIRDLARVLKTDPENLIYLAGKVPKEIGKVVAGSHAVTTILRGMKDGDFTEEELQQCLRELKEKKKGAD
jgi:transcriptional regulator with XRE-family HTH domain